VNLQVESQLGRITPSKIKFFAKGLDKKYWIDKVKAVSYKK
jgi:hypothetical protein